MKTVKENADLAFKFLIKNNILEDYWEQPRYYHALMDFRKTHGDEYLIALAGCMIWTYANYTSFGKKEETLKQQMDAAHRELQRTFAHDLGGAKDELMLPRSSDYGKYWDEHIKKIVLPVDDITS